MSNFRVLDIIDYLSTYHELHSTWAQSLQLWFTEQILGVNSMFRNDMFVITGVIVSDKGPWKRSLPIEKYHALSPRGKMYLDSSLDSDQPSSANIPDVSIYLGNPG